MAFFAAMSAFSFPSIPICARIHAIVISILCRLRKVLIWLIISCIIYDAEAGFGLLMRFIAAWLSV